VRGCGLEESLRELSMRLSSEQECKDEERSLHFGRDDRKPVVAAGLRSIPA
jgi:hypothetical protein